MADDIVARVDEVLEGVPEGPWEATDGVVWSVDVVPDPFDPTGQTPMQVQVKVCDTAPGPIARFIAASRKLVPELRDEIVRLRAENEQAVEDWGANDEQMLAENARLAAEVERLRGALDGLLDTWAASFAFAEGDAAGVISDHCAAVRAVLRGDQ